MMSRMGQYRHQTGMNFSSVSESSIQSCTSIGAPFNIIIANHFQENHCGVYYLIFLASPVSKCRWLKLVQLVKQLNEDILMVLPLETHCKGYCVVCGILMFWGKNCQCKYLQTVELIFGFDLMSLESIWPHSHKDYSCIHWYIFQSWHILMKITEKLCCIIAWFVNPVFFMPCTKNITSIPIANRWLIISLAGM